MRFAPSENLQTEIPLTSQEDKGYTLLDLHKPIVFDELKHQIDQSKFFALHHLYTSDDILICRKAEFLISMKNYDEAVITVSEVNHLLGTGILVKALTCLEAYNVVHEHCQDFYHWSIQKCLDLSPLQQEGLVHIYEMAFTVAYTERSFEFARYMLNRATLIAKELGLNNRVRTLEREQAALDTAMGKQTQTSAIKYLGFNQENIEHNNYLKFRTTWLSGSPELPTGFSMYRPVIKAWEHIISGRNIDALNSISELPNVTASDSELNLYKQLIHLTCNLEANESSVTTSENIDSIMFLLPKLKFKTNVIFDCVKLFPLASYILGYFSQEFETARASIPLLADESPRDGLRLGGRTIPLPTIYRELWLKDDANKSREMKALIDRSTKHRARDKLKLENLHEFNIVSVLKIYFCLYFLAGEDLLAKTVVEDFLLRYPNVKNYI